MRAQPRKGRYFPLSVEAVAAEIRRIDLLDDLGKPVDVSFVNPTPAQAREGVVATLTKYELTLISLPVEVDTNDGVLLWETIFASCPYLSQKRLPANTGRGPVYAFLDGLDDMALRVVARWYHSQGRKFRSTHKFGHAFKAKVTRRDEVPVVIPAEVFKERADP